MRRTIVGQALYDTKGKANLKLNRVALACGDKVYSVKIGNYEAPFKTSGEANKFYQYMCDAIEQGLKPVKIGR